MGKMVKMNNKYTLLNVHIPRFPLKAPLKPIFGIHMSDQRFEYRPLTMNIDPVQLPINSLGGKKKESQGVLLILQ